MAAGADPEVARLTDLDHPAPRPGPVLTGVLGALLGIVTVLFAVAARVPGSTFVQSYALTNLVIGLCMLGSGTVITWFRPAHVIGTLFSIGALGHLATAAATMASLYGLHAGWSTPLLRSLSTVVTGAWQLGLTGLFPIALLLFPTGRLPSRRWLPVAGLLIASGTYQLVTGILSNGSPIGAQGGPDSILSIGLTVPPWVGTVAGIVNVVAYAGAIASLFVRYRHGDEQRRRQLLWLILAMLVITALNAQRLVTADGPILLLMSFALVPVAIGIAIVRYELFDIRLALSRTLVYGLAVAAVIALYAGTVAGLSLLIPADAVRGAATAAAIVVAICFTPVRLLVQQTVNQAFYGGRSDPARTASQIGEGLRQDNDLNGVLDRTRAALRLPWIALRRQSDGSEVAASGGPRDPDPAEITLTYGDEVVGTLVVGLRRGDRRLHSADRRTLELIATPLAVALHATTLSDQVRRARAATVEVAAAERVRLQRELHDGLGPTLTSLVFTADAVSNLMRTDPDKAERLMGDVRTDLRDALDSLREVVYGLRPIELDDLGLMGALRHRIGGLPLEARRGVVIELALPAEDPVLSPAVEQAAYRIVNEGLANVLRHSTGRRCTITVSCDTELLIDICDDGAPPASWRPGVGLRAISERADELGGMASGGPTADGWRVCARLPLDAAR